jgi:hypothetical protein
MPLRRSTRNTKLIPNGTKQTRGWIGRLLCRATAAGVANVQLFRPERLEERRLLTTLTDVGTGQSNTFTFYSGQGQVCQIAYFDVEFEAIGAAVDPTTGAAAVGDLVAAANPEPAIGTNLYKIYVTESSADSYISVYTVASLTNQIPTPFAGSIPAFAITTTAGAPGMATVPGGTGGILMGALDPLSNPGPTQITQIGMNAPIGLQPVPASGSLTPGIEVIPVNTATGAQNDIGDIQIGGTVTGTVSFGANVGTFYAGAVLTGDINGDPLPPQNAPTSARVVPDNFHVAGDLRAFLTTGPVGTDGSGTGVQPGYITNFDLSVGGKLGELKIGNNERGDGTAAFAGTIEAGNSPYISQQLAYPTAAATGSVNVIGNTAIQTEIENDAQKSVAGPDLAWKTGGLDLRNDTPADAEFLDSIPMTDPETGALVRDVHGNIEYEAQVSGNFNASNTDSFIDTNDYYAAGLLAGKTIQVTLDAGTVEVFDPSGRMIASNSQAESDTFQFTTASPGVYDFDVVGPGGSDTPYDLTVSGIGQQGLAGVSIGGYFSDVGIDSSIIVGNSDLGAIEVGGLYDSSTTGPTPITAGSTLPTQTATPPTVATTSINVADGNLNALVAAAFGTETNLVISGGPYLSVSNGSVGLVQSTAGVMDLETQFDPNYLTETTPIFKTNTPYATAIGGSIQVIDAAGSFEGDLAVDGGIGTIRAADMATNKASYIDVNADNTGSDGIIDLIDVGQLGTLAAGGPSIVTNEGGDVRYLNATSAFRPEFFGGGADTPVTYNAGQVATLTDNAGNTITITPIGLVTTTVTTTTNTPAANSTTGVTNTSTSTTTTGPQITVFSYPILDKGGVIPISISSSGGMSITDSGTKGSEVNIANVSISGEGSPIVNGAVDAYGNTTISQTAPTINASTGTTSTSTSTANADGSTTVVTTNVSGGGTSTYLDLTMSGPENINVLQVTGTCNTAGTLGGVTSIINNTLGEIASVTIQSAVPGLPANVGTILVHGNLGYTTPKATAAVDLPRALIYEGNQYPFVQQHTGVVVGNTTLHQGSAVNIDAYGAIANVLVLSTVESIVANYGVSEHIAGSTPLPGQLDGLVGPIVVGDPVPITDPITTFGTLISCDIGQGIAYSGSGTVGFSGIFVSGAIGVIDNAGNSGGAIRGDIICEDDAHAVPGPAYTTGNAIGLIELNNASIINAEIATVVNLAGSTPTFYDNFFPTNIFEVNDANVAFNTPDPGEAPFASPYIYEIGSIVVSGTGGILGADVECTNVGPIVVNNGGFGVLDTTINSEDLGRVAGITASGYGVRDTTVSQCGYLGQVVATGGGPTISVLRYPIDVRESDVPGLTVDPNFGMTPIALTDLNAELGTSAQQPNISDVTDTGVIQDCVFEGQESFAGLVAQKVRTKEQLFQQSSLEPTPPIANIPYVGTDFPMEINFASGVGPIRVFQLTDGLQITTGHLVGFYPGSSVSRVGISVAGAINSLRINGNFGQYITNPQTGLQIPDSYIDAGGPSGTIGSLIVTGDLNGTISATGTIGSIFVGHDVEAGIIARGQTTGLALGSLKVQGGLRDGALVINGSAGSIVINGTLGTSTGSLNILGNVNAISVGANHKLTNSDLALSLTVGGYLRNLTVYGTISGSVNVGSDLTNLRVTGSGAATVLLTGNISVGGRIQNATFTGGSIGGSVIASNSIGTFTINRGSLLVPAIVESQIAGIGFFRILGGLSYGLYGSLLAQSGQNDRIDISGNLGDSVNTATVTALTGSTFRIRGTVATHANVQVSGQLNLLEVDGNIETGAVIAAHPLLKQKIKGSNTGSITIV